MGEVRALKPGMGREVGDVSDFVTASLADYILTEEKQPAAALLVWLDEGGSPCVSWYDLDRHSVAYIGATISKMALDE